MFRFANWEARAVQAELPGPLLCRGPSGGRANMLCSTKHARLLMWTKWCQTEFYLVLCRGY